MRSVGKECLWENIAPVCQCTYNVGRGVSGCHLSGYRVTAAIGKTWLFSCIVGCQDQRGKRKASFAVVPASTSLAGWDGSTETLIGYQASVIVLCQC